MSPAWKRYQFWRRLFWLVFFGSPVFFIGIGIPLMELFESEVPGYPVAFVVMAAFAWTGYEVGSFRCPRCGEYFHSCYWGGLPYRNPLARRCLNCGLPKWSDP